MEHSTWVEFESITMQFGLFCRQSHLKEFIQWAVLFAASILSMTFVIFQSRFGSKSIIVACFFTMALPGFVSLTLVDGLAAKTVGVTGLWVFNDVTFSLISVLLNELPVAPFRNLSNMSSRLFFSLGAFSGTS